MQQNRTKKLQKYTKIKDIVRLNATFFYKYLQKFCMLKYQTL